ncbi:MAG: DUF3800 domain-containing protein [Melioribacter sp.]|uniref:DUF3800 domain-containing protein n=1 Tax=Rosettibacter primus TaxID=3111523 RepID=UPI00247EADAE|nr:DUF3800 domain-containing protein [Melioribacter sp.]
MEILETKNLFGKSEAPQEFNVFHDESGSYNSGNWVFTGLLWVNKEHIEEICEYLQNVRKEFNYNGEIHFNKFPKSFGGDFGRKAQVAKEWFSLWKGKISDMSYFNVLSVNRTHKKYYHKRFSKDFHAYNRFTALAIKSGLLWFFKDKQFLNLRIFSDEKTRRPQGILGDGINFDNFEYYLMRRLKEDTNNYNGPKVKLLDQVQCINCPSRGPYTCEQELLQLVDLLLGAIATAVEPKTKKETKIWFAKEILPLIEDIGKEPWNQEFKLHRKFSVSYFPNNDGLIYNNGPLGIIDMDNSQLNFFGCV